MKSSLKKSLFAGLAALSFVAVAGTANAQSASAKTYAKVTSNKTISGANVAFNGTNALYTKAGTLKGAKVVATTTTTKALANAQTGKANLRAYRVATTNRGSVYYKVVSFDKQYRGWVYGGKSTSAFAGGVASYATTKDATAPASTNTYKLNSTSTTANTTLFKAPAWTQYKVGRAVVDGKTLTSTDAYKDAVLTFNKAVTTSREGDTWYQVASVNGSTTNGLVGAWVKASDVTQTNAPTTVADNAVRINFNDQSGKQLATLDYVKSNAAKGTTLGSLQSVNGGYAWKLDTNTSNDLQSKINSALQGTGYAFNVSNNESVLAQAKTGDSITLTLTKGDVVYQALTPTAYNVNTQSDAASLTVNPKAQYNNNISNNLLSTRDLAVSKDTTLDLSLLADANGAAKPDGLKDVVAKYVSGSSDNLATLNSAVAAEAAKYYAPIANLQASDLFSGSKGASFSANDVMSYINGHASLQTLKSPVYPVFSANGSVDHWAQFDYTAQTAYAGTFGQSSAVKVLYSYNPSKAVSTSFPTSSSTGYNPFA